MSTWGNNTHANNTFCLHGHPFPGPLLLTESKSTQGKKTTASKLRELNDLDEKTKHKKMLTFAEVIRKKPQHRRGRDHQHQQFRLCLSPGGPTAVTQSLFFHSIQTLPWSFMSGWAEMVIWVPRCISFSISNTDLGTGVGSSTLTQEHGKEWSHTNLVIVKQKKKNPASYRHDKDFHLLI